MQSSLHDAAFQPGIPGSGEAAMDFACSLLDADIPVTVFEAARDSLDRATASMRAHCQNAVAQGELADPQRDRRVALLAGTVNLHHLKDCDVIADMLSVGQAEKDGLLRRLNKVARTDAILLACAVDGDVGRIASQMRFPENVLGMRQLDDASAGQWQLKPARGTSERALAAATRLVRH